MAGSRLTLYAEEHGCDSMGEALIDESPAVKLAQSLQFIIMDEFIIERAALTLGNPVGLIAGGLH